MFRATVTIASLVLALIAAAPVAAAAGAGAHPFKAIVSDMDGVLAYPIMWNSATEPRPDGILLPQTPGSKSHYRFVFRVAHGAPEFIEFLTRVADQVMIWSSKPQEQNAAVLREITLPDGRSALSAIGSAHVFSGDKMQNSRKDLKDILGDRFDPEYTLLLEDWKDRAAPSQAHNLLWVTPAQATYEDDEIQLGLDYPDELDAKDRDWDIERFRERNKLVRAAGLIVEAIKMSSQSGSTPVEALQKLQHEDGSYAYEATHSLKIYEQGLQALREVNPAFRLTEENLICKALLTEREL